MRDLTEDEVLGAIQSSASLEGRIKLTCESGPYDIDRPTNVAMIFAAAVQRKFREVNGIDGVSVARDHTASPSPTDESKR